MEKHRVRHGATLSDLQLRSSRIYSAWAQRLIDVNNETLNQIWVEHRKADPRNTTESCIDALRRQYDVYLYTIYDSVKLA